MWIIEYFFFAIGLKIVIEELLDIKNIILSLFSNKDLSTYGIKSWALVTACTDGIGQGFAVILAKKGFNIIQVGRNPDKLNATANELILNYGIQVKNVVKDFSNCPNDPIRFYQDIYLQTKDLDISIIINNVGTSSGTVYLADTPVKMILNQIALNLFPICFISRLFLPKIFNRPQGGAIINLSSISRFTNNKGSVQYCACKSFDHIISNFLTSEVDSRTAVGKVDVLCLLPGYVDTPLVKARKNKPLLINKYECAEAALKCLGSVAETSGHWKHLIILLISPIVAYLR